MMLLSQQVRICYQHTLFIAQMKFDFQFNNEEAHEENDVDTMAVETRATGGDMPKLSRLSDS